MKNSTFAALALTGLLSAASLSALAATSSTGKTDPVGSPPSPATQESQDSMGTGLDTNGGAIIDNGADPRPQWRHAARTRRRHWRLPAGDLRRLQALPRLTRYSLNDHALKDGQAPSDQ